MSVIRLRFVTSADALSFAIRGATGGFLYSHVECIMPDGRFVGAHADGGVEARPAGYDAKYDPIETIVEVPATDAQTGEVHDYLLAQIGKPYDFLAIAALAGREAWPTMASILKDDDEPWSTPAAWFCSELVMAALIAGEILPKLSLTPRRVTPRDLFFVLSAIVPVGGPAVATRPQASAMQARPV